MQWANRSQSADRHGLRPGFLREEGKRAQRLDLDFETFRYHTARKPHC
jgi:hypothetical protein